MKIRGGIKFTLNPEVRWKNSEEDYPLARVARSMLWYVYSLYVSYTSNWLSLA